MMIGNAFWPLIFFSLLFLAWGLSKKSWKAMLISGCILLLPSLYFMGAEGWMRLLVILPLILFACSYIFQKDAKQAVDHKAK